MPLAGASICLLRARTTEQSTSMQTSQNTGQHSGEDCRFSHSLSSARGERRPCTHSRQSASYGRQRLWAAPEQTPAPRTVLTVVLRATFRKVEAMSELDLGDFSCHTREDIECKYAVSMQGGMRVQSVHTFSTRSSARLWSWHSQLLALQLPLEDGPLRCCLLCTLVGPRH